MAVTELSDLLLGKVDGEVAVIDDNEVVARAVHFGEIENHSGFMF